MGIHPPAAPFNASVILPKELIIEILSRLNVKSLMEVKCVCKSWNTLISDPIFIKKHLNLSKRNPHLVYLSETYLYSYTSSPISVSHLLENTSNSITLTNDPYRVLNCRGIVGSCNGLICLHQYYWDFHLGCPDHLFYFCNLATGTKSETLSSFDSFPTWRYHIIRFGFGYDNSTNTYKAVMLGFTDLGNQGTTAAKVFTLGDDIWRDIQSFFPVEAVLPNKHQDLKYDGVYLSNSICWLFRKNLIVKKFVIISLDLGTETYTLLSLPSSCDDDLPLDNPTLCVLMDSICFSYDYKATHLVIWQMKEFGVEESWTQFLKISYLKYELADYRFHLLPLCVSENDATLILATTNVKNRNHAILYNWRHNRVKKIEKSSEILWFTAKEYVESLVSPC